MKQYGLIGYPLGHSFSQAYFKEKFRREKIEADYINFPIPRIEEFPNVLKENPMLCGLNVTVPFKEKVIPFLDEIDKTAEEIGAVNTIKISRQGKNSYAKGYNTDAVGFEMSINPLLKKHHTKALVLGTGGASKAIAYTLRKLGVEFLNVSRQQKKKCITYRDLSARNLSEFPLIVHTTPLGMFPKIEGYPQINYEEISSAHLVVDLVYNPEETPFLKKSKAQGAAYLNGLNMLHHQAEKAWEIYGAW